MQGRMKLTTLKARLPSLGPRLPQAGRIEVTRMRGRAAVERRGNYLRLHPLCVRCEQQNRTEAATVPDHVIPLWAGGEDDLEKNGQPLCTQHHDAKTACEARMRVASGWLSTPCTCGQHRDAPK
jgi:hypothetical protein